MVRKSPIFCELEPDVFGIGKAIREVNRTSFQGGSSNQRAASRWNWVALDEKPVVVGKTLAGSEMIGPTLEAEDECALGFAQPRRQFHERVEHWLKIECRTADDLENVGGGGLLLQ